MMYDIAFSPVERRGGAWGYWRMYADSSRFIARSWRTKREATEGRLRDAQNEKLKVRLDTSPAKRGYPLGSTEKPKEADWPLRSHA